MHWISRGGFTVEAKVELGNAESDAFILRAAARSGCTMCNRYWLRVTMRGTEYWYAGEWQPLQDDVAPAASGVYRMAVRDDTCVQIYRDGRLLAAYPASYEIGFGADARQLDGVGDAARGRRAGGERGGV